MLAWPAGWVRVAVRAGFWLRLVPPLSFSTNFGLKARAEQAPTWKGLETGVAWPMLEVIEPTTWVGSQEVGLRVKSGRSSLTAMLLMSRGMPWRIEGSGSLTARPWAV